MCCMFLVTHPLDVAKTRLQLQEHRVKLGQKVGGAAAKAEGGVKIPEYRGMIRTTVGMLHEEGSTLFSLFL